MANRPKQYGGTTRGSDREREEQGRQNPREQTKEPRRAGPKRASESDVWEREENLGQEDRDIEDVEDRNR